MKHKKNQEEVPAPEGGEVAQEAAPAETRKPEAVCGDAEKAKAQAAEYYDQLIRLKAEFENYCKRTEKQRPEWIDYGKQQVICKLLPLYDALMSARTQLEKAEAAATDGVRVSPELAKGLEMIFSEFERVLQGEGIKPMECLGRPYDPHSHEAVAVLPSDAANDGVVMAEVQKGFTCGSKVLRPARVCIGRKKEEEGGKEAPADKEDK